MNLANAGGTGSRVADLSRETIIRKDSHRQDMARQLKPKARIALSTGILLLGLWIATLLVQSGTIPFGEISWLGNFRQFLFLLLIAVVLGLAVVLYESVEKV